MGALWGTCAGVKSQFCARTEESKISKNKKKDTDVKRML